MQYSSNINPTDDPTAPERIPWYNVWIDVTTSPSRATFRHILTDPTSSPVRAYMWVGVVSFLITIAQLLITPQTIGNQLDRVITGFPVVTLLCAGIAAPVMGIVGFLIATGITHFIAGLFGGSGKFDDLAYCLGAIQAPLGIFSGLISILISVLGGFGNSTVMQMLLMIPALLSLAMGIYGLVLEVLAVAEAENLATGRAALVVLLPILIGFALGICLAVFAISTFASQLPNLQ